jgi:transcriptional regulator with XRE-family HTH domain
MTQLFSSSQLRAARALLNWSRADLAKQTGISEPTLHRLENEMGEPETRTQNKIRGVLEAHGIEFVGKIGVQWAQHQVKTLTGSEGLKTFFDDVWQTVQVSDDEIVMGGIAERYLEKKLPDFIEFQRKRMAELGKIKMRCLIEEGDMNIGASRYCRYRWQTKKHFAHVPFYVYGDKMAIIATTGPEDPLILLINNRTIAEAYRRQFELMWSAGREVPGRERTK